MDPFYLSEPGPLVDCPDPLFTLGGVVGITVGLVVLKSMRSYSDVTSEHEECFKGGRQIVYRDRL